MEIRRFVGDVFDGCCAGFDLGSLVAVSDRQTDSWCCAYFFWIQVFLRPRHVLRKAKNLEFLCNGCLDDLLEAIFGMAWAELARMAVMRKGHCI